MDGVVATDIAVGHDAGLGTPPPEFEQQQQEDVPPQQNEQEGGEREPEREPERDPEPAVPHGNSFAKANAKQFDPEKDTVQQGLPFIMHVRLHCQLAGLKYALWGLYLLSLLTYDYMRLVYNGMKVPFEAGATGAPNVSVFTWEAVCSALQKACTGVSETDQERYGTLLRSQVPDGKGRFVKLLDAFEQIFLKMDEPLPLSGQIFFICLKIPQKYRARFQFDAGQPWTDKDKFRRNFVSQAALIEDEMARENKSNGQGKGPSKNTSNKGGSSNGHSGHSGHKRPRNDSKPSGNNSNTPTNNASSSKPRCNACNQIGHLPYWKDKDGKFMCPKKGSSSNKTS